MVRHRQSRYSPGLISAIQRWYSICCGLAHEGQAAIMNAKIPWFEDDVSARQTRGRVFKSPPGRGWAPGGRAVHGEGDGPGNPRVSIAI